MHAASGAGSYKGFRVTGHLMRSLAQLDPSVGGGVLLRGEGFLG